MRLTLLLSLVATTVACARAPAKPTGAAADPGATAAVAAFYPLAVGNTWTFVDESPGLPVDRRSATRTVTIVGQTPDGFFKDSERGELRVSGGCLHDRLRRLLCAPLDKGARWSSVVSVSSTERFEIAGVGERVQTPAGTFDGCVRVRATNRAGAGMENVLEITYAPRVGPVRLETFAVVNGQVSPQVRAVLRSYQVGSK